MNIIVNSEDYNIQSDKRLLIPYVQNKTGLIGFINKRGHTKFTYSFNSVYDDFYSVDDVVRVGEWAVCGDKHIFVKSVIKTDGRYLFKDRYKEIIMSEDRQRFVVENSKGEWAVIDRAEKEIVPYGKYDWIDGFRNGVARVKQGKITNGNNIGEKLWGIINTEGKEILPVAFPNIHSFVDDSKGYITIEYFNEEKVESIYTEGYFEPLPCPSRIKQVSFSTLHNLSANTGFLGIMLVSEMRKEKELYHKRIEEYKKILPEIRKSSKDNMFNKPFDWAEYYRDMRSSVDDAYEGDPDARWNTD